MNNLQRLADKNYKYHLADRYNIPRFDALTQEGVLAQVVMSHDIWVKSNEIKVFFLGISYDEVVWVFENEDLCRFEYGDSLITAIIDYTTSLVSYISSSRLTDYSVVIAGYLTDTPMSGREHLQFVHKYMERSDGST